MLEINQNIKIAVDAIVFGYAHHRLHVLLIKQKFGLLKGQWALVGGFVKDEEKISDAVKRELREEAGLEVNYLEQLYTFGDDLNRDPRFRVVTVTYFALVNSTNLFPEADTDATEARWFPIKELPDLAFDHALIIATAQDRLKAKLTYQPIGFDLLPEKFPFSDLESLYCTILGTEIDRRNFRKKIMSFGILEETNIFENKKSGRPGKLFQFNKQKFSELSEKGFHFEIKLNQKI
jgi:8-oxo-dGTP diphosphatase